jgi:hypothetical protein
MEVSVPSFTAPTNKTDSDMTDSDSSRVLSERPETEALGERPGMPKEARNSLPRQLTGVSGYA